MRRPAAAVADDLRALVDGVGALPAPGRGGTAQRHHRLAEVARTCSVSLARLFEAHVDAIAILAEAQVRPRPGALYGVWASEVPEVQVRLADDHRVVHGAKPFCSGLGVVDRALVTAEDGDGRRWLVDLDVRAPSSRADADGWATTALADTHTGSIELDQPVDAIVAGPGWYLSRPGFWHGACGPAACWAGGALGIVDVAERVCDDDPHRRAHLGAMRAAAWQLRAVLDEAGRQIDAEPGDGRAAEVRARSVRHVIERGATEIVDRFGVAFGPRPFTTEPATAQRVADLHLYLRQDHGERDLEELGSGS